MISGAHTIGSHSVSHARDGLALLCVTLFSAAVLWFGGAAVSELAMQGVIGSLRPHTPLAGMMRSSEPADYGRAFDYVVAPLRADAAATVRSIRIEARDLMPLPWGWGWL